MSYLDFTLLFLVNYSIGVGIWSFARGRLVWYDPLFIVLTYLSLSVLSKNITSSHILSEVIAIILTLSLYTRIFLPITYPIKKKVTHEPANDTTVDK
jgi:hypothetical protein